jgi:Glycosidases
MIAIVKSQLAIQRYGWGANFLENHDQPRSIDKYIKDSKYQNKIGAKALALLFFCLRGCPFIYQGQELGVRNIKRTSIDEFNDISSKDNYYRAIEEGFTQSEALKFVNDRSRDNARIPYPWTSNLNDGFNDGHKPWLALGKHDPLINWNDEDKDPDSILNFYRKMIQVRKGSSLTKDLTTGEFSEIKTTDSSVISYQRGNDAQIYINLSSKKVAINLPTGKVTLNNYSSNITNELQPYQAILIEVKNND